MTGSDDRDEGGEPACYAAQFEELLFGEPSSEDADDEPEPATAVNSAPDPQRSRP